MGIKVQWWPQREKYYIVVHHKRQRFTKAFGTDLTEVEKAKTDLEITLKLYGTQGLEDWFSETDAPSALTVKQYAERWTNELDASDLRLSTRMCYKTQLTHHILPVFGDQRLTDVAYADIKGLDPRKSSEVFEGYLPADGRHRPCYFSGGLPGAACSGQSIHGPGAVLPQGRE